MFLIEEDNIKWFLKSFQALMLKIKRDKQNKISSNSLYVIYCWLPVGNETVLAIAKMKYRKLKCDFIFGLIPLCDFSSLKDHSRKRTHRYLANQILPQFLCNRLSLLCLYHKVPAVIFLQYCFSSENTTLSNHNSKIESVSAKVNNFIFY